VRVQPNWDSNATAHTADAWKTGTAVMTMMNPLTATIHQP
jgi:hypothetical protein